MWKNNEWYKILKEKSWVNVDTTAQNHPSPLTEPAMRLPGDNYDVQHMTQILVLIVIKEIEDGKEDVHASQTISPGREKEKGQDCKGSEEAAAESNDEGMDHSTN